MKLKKNILITGGKGFVAKSLLVGLSKAKYNIYAPSHSELDILDGNAVVRFVKDNNINVVIHSAIKGGKDVLVNTLKMFDNVAKLSGIVEKIIHLGSGAEYGKSRDLKKINENCFGEYVPLDDYGFAKYLCSKISKNYKNIITLRIFGLYGIYDDYLNKFISNSIVKNILSLPINIKQDVVFDYLYIGDFIRIVDFFIQNKNKYKFYNVTPSRSIRLTEIVNIINSLSMKKTKVTIDNVGLNYEYTGSNSRLCKELFGFKFTSYKKGIGVLFKFLSKNKHKFDFDAIISNSYYLNAKIRNYVE